MQGCGHCSLEIGTLAMACDLTSDSTLTITVTHAKKVKPSHHTCPNVGEHQNSRLSSAIKKLI